MREQEFTISEALKIGLRPIEVMPEGSQALTECLGFRCGDIWLEGYDPLANPLPIGLDLHYDWPFPQLITGELYNILVVRNPTLLKDTIYLVSDDHVTVTILATIDEGIYGLGTLIEVADFGSYCFMTNGVVMIYYDVDASLWRIVTSLANVPMMRTVCNFKGQMIGGCVLSDWHGCDDTFIVWSNIGELNFTPDRKNEAGFRRDPFGGEIFHVRRLGDNVVVYSSKGVTLMMPVGSPTATFGFVELIKKGVINRGAVNGSLGQHILVDTEYNIWKITKEGTSKLGYKEFIKKLADEYIIVNYNPDNDDFYIGNSTKTYLLSSIGLTEIPQHPSTVWKNDGATHMLPSLIDDYNPLIVSDRMDFGIRDMKTIFVVESGISDSLSPEVAADWTNNNVWAITDYVPMNDQGVGTLIISGTDFRIRLRLADINPGTIVSYIKLRFKMTDLRSIRGIYASPPRGQTF